MFDWILELPFIDPFHTQLYFPGLDSVANPVALNDLQQSPMILSPLNSTLNSPGVCLPCGADGVINHFALSFSKFSHTTSLIKSSTF